MIRLTESVMKAYEKFNTTEGEKKIPIPMSPKAFRQWMRQNNVAVKSTAHASKLLDYAVRSLDDAKDLVGCNLCPLANGTVINFGDPKYKHVDARIIAPMNELEFALLSAAFVKSSN